MKFIALVVVVCTLCISSPVLVEAQKKCYACDVSTWSNCSDQTPWCARGPTQCFSGYAGYTDASGRLQYKLLKGCLDCANRTVGCENLKKRMSPDFTLNITQCYVDCCDDNECNTKEPNPPTPPPPRASSPQLSSLSLALPVSLVVQAYFIL